MLTGLFLKLFLPCPHGGRGKRPPRASTSPNARWGSTALYLHTTGLPLSRMRRNTPRAAVLRRRKKSAHRDKSRECGSRSGVHRYGVHRVCAQKHATFEKIYSQRAPARSIRLSVVLQRFHSALRRTCEAPTCNQPPATAAADAYMRSHRSSFKKRCKHRCSPRLA